MSVACLPTGQVAPAAILEMAKQREFEDVIILGRTKDGDLSIMGSTDNLAEIHWFLTLGATQIVDATRA